ncbi:MAG: ImmA/IrrE family metallo-endopeptidase [Pyrinomonadaceae bacterium]|nr:ImmA/IrrE family metallo-endopeptidase [Pyrinomonadaceae bacterium]
MKGLELTPNIRNGSYSEMLPEIIKDRNTYERVLDEINLLMDIDPDPNSNDGKHLELLVHLIEGYENKISVAPATNPIDAILFRMEQSDLKQTDLVPFIGSRSKVSEVLSGKRTLTLPMIQALHTGLGIPATVLLQPMTSEVTEPQKTEWKRFPLKEMCSRGWLTESYEAAKRDAENVISKFIDSVGGLDRIYALNKASTVRAGREMNRYALTAWTVRILTKALENPPEKKWSEGSVTMAFMREIAKLSVLPDGPLQAQRVLREHGISLITEASLPQTYLDGSAIMVYVDHPIIGLSLRHDRVDNFWFSLMHELAHISLHFGQGVSQFFDDLDIKKIDDPKEVEADKVASEALIPIQKWASSPARVAPSKNTILRFASHINVHPAIVAGRVRREKNSYHLFNDLVGHGRIRYLFGMVSE